MCGPGALLLSIAFNSRLGGVIVNSRNFNPLLQILFQDRETFLRPNPASTIHLLALAAHAALGPGRQLVDVLDVCQPVLPGHRAHQVMPVTLNRIHAQ